MRNLNKRTFRVQRDRKNLEIVAQIYTNIALTFGLKKFCMWVAGEMRNLNRWILRLQKVSHKFWN